MTALVDTPESKEVRASRRSRSQLREETPEPVRLGAPYVKVDGTAARLAWAPVPEACEYWVQVAADVRFEDLYFDASVGDSTEVTLYETLPADGSRFHWRVRARTSDGWTGYSPSVAIEAVTGDEARAWREKIEQQRGAEEYGRAGVARPEPQPVTQAPYLTDTTSFLWAALFIGGILATVAGLIMLGLWL